MPQKEVKIRKIDKLKPWLTNADFLSKVKAKNDLYAQLLRQPGGLTQSDKSGLNKLTKEVNSLSKDMKRAFFAQKL